jgi:hypothetical protein
MIADTEQHGRKDASEESEQTEEAKSRSARPQARFRCRMVIYEGELSQILRCRNAQTKVPYGATLVWPRNDMNGEAPEMLEKNRCSCG